MDREGVETDGSGDGEGLASLGGGGAFLNLLLLAGEGEICEDLVEGEEEEEEDQRELLSHSGTLVFFDDAVRTGSMARASHGWDGI